MPSEMTTLFEVPFASVMSDRHLAQLARTLDLSTHVHPAARLGHDSQGVARLDGSTGLFLERDGDDDRWLLRATTWGRPAPSSVHQWHVLAAGAAHQLDPSVQAPERLPRSESGAPDRRVGSGVNRRFSSLRRHLVGLD